MKILVAHAVSRSTHARYLAALAEQDQNVLRDVTVHVDWAMDDGAEYSLAKARNRCREFALRGGFDVLIAVDADTVIERLPSVYPPFGIAKVRDYNGNPNYQPAGWYALRREVFETRAWCEGFKGHGYEERDYEDNVCRGVPIAIVGDFLCRHMPHPPTPTKPANALLYRSRRLSSR